MKSERRNTLVRGLAIGIVITAGLSGCSATADTPASIPRDTATATGHEYVTPRTMPEGKGSGKADGDFPRTVKHFQGSTTLEKEPNRVVVVSTGQADALLTLGVVPVGSTSAAGASLIPDYLTKAFPAQEQKLKAVSNVGSRFAPNLEAIANVKPDLILMNTAGKDAAALYASLSSLAPTVATQGTGVYWKQDFLLLADAVGKTHQAEKWLTTYQDAAAAFGKTVTGDPTVSFVRKNAGRMRVFGVASFAGSVAEDSGLARPSTQTFTNATSVDISEEQLAQADGDWLFFGVQGGSSNELTDLPLWPTLSAVSAKHAAAVDDDTFYLNVGPTAASLVLKKLESTLG